MTTEELVNLIRITIDDTVEPYLVSADLILSQASLAQVEFAEQTLVLFGETSVSIEANNPWVTLPDNMTLVRSLLLNGKQVRPVYTQELDFGYYAFGSIENTERFSGWRDAKGIPKFLVIDMLVGRGRLVPVPTTNATASVEGYVHPQSLVLATAGVTAVDPMIPAAYHELLVSGTLYRLYSSEEVEITDMDKAQKHKQVWLEGIALAQQNLRTALRRQERMLEPARGFTRPIGQAQPT